MPPLFVSGNLAPSINVFHGEIDPRHGLLRKMARRAVTSLCHLTRPGPATLTIATEGRCSTSGTNRQKIRDCVVRFWEFCCGRIGVFMAGAGRLDGVHRDMHVRCQARTPRPVPHCEHLGNIWILRKFAAVVNPLCLQHL